MHALWTSTVRGLMPSCVAISRFWCPAASRERVSRSRTVSRSMRRSEEERAVAAARLLRPDDGRVSPQLTTATQHLLLPADQQHVRQLSGFRVLVQLFPALRCPRSLRVGEAPQLNATFNAGGSNNAPDTRGYTVQVEYVPLDKMESWGRPWVNLRVGLQYTRYLRFNGGTS